MSKDIMRVWLREACNYIKSFWPSHIKKKLLALHCYVTQVKCDFEYVTVLKASYKE